MPLSFFRGSPVQAGIGFHKAIKGRAGERLGEGIEHGSDEKFRRLHGMLCRNLKDDLIVQPCDRAAIDAVLE